MDFNDINKLSGSKVKRILEIISDIHKKGEKVVVFTQWIALINILDVHLRSKDILFEVTINHMLASQFLLIMSLCVYL